MIGTDPSPVGAKSALSSLFSLETIRIRARMVFEAGLAGKLPHFTVHLEKLPEAAAYVAATIRQNYPSLQVPPHARWRHLNANGRDWAERLAPHLSNDSKERARQRIELAITSVLLDAGAGPAWQWRDPVTGGTYSRSEGLALASLEAFRAGLFSSNPNAPCQADVDGLGSMNASRLSDIFQVSAANPLVGMEGRAALVQALGRAVAQNPRVFGTERRLGGLFDTLAAATVERQAKGVEASQVFSSILEGLRDVWPSRLVVDGVKLGDTWRHSAVTGEGATRNLMPFHKLSQWLTYSLIEPLAEAGLPVVDQEQLTGLAEYRNGGLLIDMGVIVPRNPSLTASPLTPDSEAIVEWRALTIALLDGIAPLVRSELGVNAEQMPLASILEGGTWSAGRRIAREKRADGGPPLDIVSDGTVF